MKHAARSIMPSNSGGLDPMLKQYMQQQRTQAFFAKIAQMGQGMIEASMRGADIGPALAAGIGRASGGGGSGTDGGLLDMLKLQGVLDKQREGQEKRQRGQRQDFSRQALSTGQMPAGVDPRNNIDWSTGRPVAKSEQIGLAAEAYPEAAAAAAGEKYFPAPTKPPAGMQTTTEGGLEYLPGYVEARGQLADATREPIPQYTGDLQFDTAVGKYYQTNPKTGKREYSSPLTGMEITTPGGVTIRTGVPRGGAGGMEKKTRGDIEKKLVGAREGLSRLRGIATKFKPEFQEIPTRLGVAWTGLKARFGAGDISLEDRRGLTEFADYRRDAISNINLYIKDITGAQMSATETDRLRLAVPDPGEGIFGGDDPITFQAKLDSAIRDIEKAATRYEHYLAQGITDPEEMARRMPLDAMPIYVNPETDERIVEIDGQWVTLK